MHVVNVGTRNLGSSLILLGIMKRIDQPLPLRTAAQGVSIRHVPTLSSFGENLWRDGQVLTRRKRPIEPLSILNAQHVVESHRRNQQSGFPGTRHRIAQRGNRENRVIADVQPDVLGGHVLAQFHVHVPKRKMPVGNLPIIGLAIRKRPVLHAIMGFGKPFQETTAKPRFRFFQKNFSIDDENGLRIHVDGQGVRPRVGHLVLEVNVTRRRQSAGQFVQHGLIRGQSNGHPVSRPPNQRP